MSRMDFRPFGGSEAFQITLNLIKGGRQHGGKPTSVHPDYGCNGVEYEDEYEPKDVLNPKSPNLRSL